MTEDAVETNWEGDVLLPAHSETPLLLPTSPSSFSALPSSSCSSPSVLVTAAES